MSDYEWPPWSQVMEYARSPGKTVSVLADLNALDAILVETQGPPARREAELVQAALPRYRYREAVVFTPKEDRRAFTPPLVAGMPVAARYYRRVGGLHWLDLPEYGGRATSIVVCGEDEFCRVEDAPPIVEIGTVKSVGPGHLEVTGVHSQEAMAALHEELTDGELRRGERTLGDVPAVEKRRPAMRALERGNSEKGA